MEDFLFSQEASFAISTLTGQQLLGNRRLPAKRPTVTEYFENNFPPWRIEFFTGGMENFGIVDIKKKFLLLDHFDHFGSSHLWDRLYRSRSLGDGKFTALEKG